MIDSVKVNLIKQESQVNNAELRKELVAEMKKKQPDQSRIQRLNEALDLMDAEVAARGVQVFAGSFGEPEPMAPAKTVPVELKSKAYKAIERESIVGDKDAQAKADAAMDAHFAGKLSDDEYRYWASRQAEFELLH